LQAVIVSKYLPDSSIPEVIGEPPRSFDFKGKSIDEDELFEDISPGDEAMSSTRARRMHYKQRHDRDNQVVRRLQDRLEAAGTSGEVDDIVGEIESLQRVRRTPHYTNLLEAAQIQLEILLALEGQSVDSDPIDEAMAVKADAAMITGELASIGGLNDVSAMRYYKEHIGQLRTARGDPNVILEQQSLWEQRKKQLLIKLDRESQGIVSQSRELHNTLTHELLDEFTDDLTPNDFITLHLAPTIMSTRKKRLLLGYAGTFASGKTTVAMNIIANPLIKNTGWLQRVISFDDFLLEKSDRPDPGTEDPYVKFNVVRYKDFLEKLAQNVRATKPIYDQTAKGQLKFGLDEEDQAEP